MKIYVVNGAIHLSRNERSLRVFFLRSIISVLLFNYFVLIDGKVFKRWDWISDVVDFSLFQIVEQADLVINRGKETFSCAWIVYFLLTRLVKTARSRGKLVSIACCWAGLKGGCWNTIVITRQPCYAHQNTIGGWWPWMIRNNKIISIPVLKFFSLVCFIEQIARLLGCLVTRRCSKYAGDVKISARRSERISIHSGIHVRGFDFKGVRSKHQIKLIYRNFHHLWKPTSGISNRNNCYCSWPWWQSFFCSRLDAEGSNDY